MQVSYLEKEEKGGVEAPAWTPRHRLAYQVSQLVTSEGRDEGEREGHGGQVSMGIKGDLQERYTLNYLRAPPFQVQPKRVTD